MRASRRGIADLVIMIVMIVFLLGMGALAFFAYDKAEREDAYVAHMRSLKARQRSELDATKARFAELSSYIGFKGRADHSSPDAIRRMLSAGGDRVARYIEFKAGNLEQKGTIFGIELTVRDKDGGSKKMPAVAKTATNNKKLYEWSDGITLRDGIGYQDQVIQQLVTEHIPQIHRQWVLQRKWRDDAARDRKASSDANYVSVNAGREASDNEIAAANAEAVAAEEAFAAAVRDEGEANLALSSETVSDERKEARNAMRRTGDARLKAASAQQGYRIKSDARGIDDSRDPDGYVFLVDEIAGWVWINIGRRSDVRLNLTFQVMRADASRSSMTAIGEIRVKELLRGNIARCRVDALDDPEIYPRTGDMIRNATWNSRTYQSFCLVGEFGGEYTTHTRPELVDMLLNFGFTVVPRITLATDAAIIGGNWREDAIFRKAEDDGLNFEKFTEEEVLRFLGLDGPNPIK